MTNVAELKKNIRVILAFVVAVYLFVFTGPLYKEQKQKSLLFIRFCACVHSVG